MFYATTSKVGQNIIVMGEEFDYIEEEWAENWLYRIKTTRTIWTGPSNMHKEQFVTEHIRKPWDELIKQIDKIRAQA